MRFSLLLVLLIAIPLQADDFVLRNGRKVSGKLLNADENPRKTYRIQLETGGDVTLDVERVSRVIVPTPEKRKYKELLAKMPAETAENHWKMAQQCLAWSLSRELKFHLEQTVIHDPNHELARRALKHKQREDGTWDKKSVINEEAGLVKVDGRWVPKQEAQIRIAENERRDAEIQWKKKAKMWRGWLSGSRRGEALQQISAIDDPVALEPLIELFRKNTDAGMREVLADVLARFNNARATGVLVEASLYGSRDLQIQCVRLLEKHGHTSAAKRYLQELKSQDNKLVRRAGYALGILGDDQAILPLIHAVTTTHTKLVGGRGDGRINAGSGGLSAGQTKPQKVDRVLNNKEVHSALVSLTDQNFEYNKQKWLDWYRRQSTPPNLDLRREQ